MRPFGIATDSDHRGARLLEVFKTVPEGTHLRRTGWRIVLGIEEQHDLSLASKIRQPDDLARCVRQSKIRRNVAYLERFCSGHDLTCVPSSIPNQYYLRCTPQATLRKRRSPQSH